MEVPSHLRFNIKFMISHSSARYDARAGTACNVTCPNFLFVIGIVDSYMLIGLQLPAVAYSFARAFANILSPNGTRLVHSPTFYLPIYSDKLIRQFFIRQLIQISPFANVLILQYFTTYGIVQLINNLCFSQLNIQFKLDWNTDANVTLFHFTHMQAKLMTLYLSFRLQSTHLCTRHVADACVHVRNTHAKFGLRALWCAWEL